MVYGIDSIYTMLKDKEGDGGATLGQEMQVLARVIRMRDRRLSSVDMAILMGLMRRLQELQRLSDEVRQLSVDDEEDDVKLCGLADKVIKILGLRPDVMDPINSTVKDRHPV